MSDLGALWSDEDLDRAWDELDSIEPAEAHDESFGMIVATARYLASHDDVAGPRAEFVRGLGIDLRSMAKEPAMQAVNPNGTMPRSARAGLSPISEPAWGRRRWSRLTGLSLLIAALVIAAIGLGANSSIHGLLRNSSPTQPAQPSAGLASLPASTPISAAQPVPPSAMDGGDAARTGVVPGPGPAGEASVAWTRAFSGSNGLVVAGNRAFFTMNGPANGLLVAAVDLKSGATLWTAPIDRPAIGFAYPSVADGLVFVPLTDTVRAFDQASGAAVWSYAVGTDVNTMSATVANGLVYVSARDETLRAIDASTGKEKWRASIPDSTVNASMAQAGILTVIRPATVAGGVVYTIGNGGVVLASDAATGKEIWTFQTPSDQVSSPVVSNGVVLLTVTNLNTVQTGVQVWTQAVDAQSGKLLWQLTDDRAGEVGAVKDGTVYLVGMTKDANVLEAVRLTDGHPLWSYKISGRMGVPLLANGVLYVYGDDGSLSGIDITTHRAIFSAKLGVITGLGVGGGLLVVGHQGSIFAVKGSSSLGTPAAVSSPTDLSGLPVCVQPRIVPSVFPTGTPAATLDATTKVPGKLYPGTIAEILTKNLPSGAPASSADVAGIQQSLDAIENCSIGRVDESETISGFFTDDFYRRGPGAGAGNYHPGWPTASSLPLPTIVQTATLDDGRIAVQVGFGGSPRYLLMFKQQGGLWLIDERYAIVDAYSSGQGNG